MKGLPLFATLVVAVAVAIMVGLGFWQLGRAAEKEALLARYAENARAGELLVGDEIDVERDLFRRARVTCRPAPEPVVQGAGRFGFRLIAECRRLGDGTTLFVQLGTDPRATARASFAGGEVRGTLAFAPDSRSLLRELFDAAPTPPMIVADPPLGGLRPSPSPSIAEIPNNHRSYAFQWFSFAAIALVIYALALRARRRRAP